MSFDLEKFVNPRQVGGIERYVIDDGQGRGVRVCEVNTGGGLRYRVLLDRGLDIDQAFMNQHSLAFLSHQGVSAPTRAFDHGTDWGRGFPGGLLVTCGPFNTGSATVDAGDHLGLHGPHSNTPGELEAVVQPDPHSGRSEMLIRGRVRYGAFYGPNLILCRTIRSVLGQNAIWVEDVFTNEGNKAAPHAWLLHINFGYPLLDEGTELVVDITEQLVREDGQSPLYFENGGGKEFPSPADDQAGDRHVFRYLTPRVGSGGRNRVGVWNAKLSLGVAIDYSPEEFPRLGQWLHWGKREYVAALEPMTGGVEGRDKDRARGWIRMIETGHGVTYRYALEVVTDRNEINLPMAYPPSVCRSD
jgi:hypothetical protein